MYRNFKITFFIIMRRFANSRALFNFDRYHRILKIRCNCDFVLTNNIFTKNVMRKVWIDWCKNHERQNVNLCTIITNQLFDHHSFNMNKRQNFCQMSCKNIRSNFKSFIIDMFHNRKDLIKTEIIKVCILTMIKWNLIRLSMNF